MQLSGQVASITGASAGIGLTLAEHLSREGVAVVLGARRTDRLADAVDRIRSAGGRAEAVTMDVTREEDMLGLVARAQASFGRLDIMICNAGFGFYGTVEETPPDVMRRILDVNFMGTFLGARAALPIFRRQGSGHLVFISSIAGKRGIPNMGGYTASKFAQAGLAESLRSEFVGTNIHVSVVFPVSTATEFHHALERDYGYDISGVGPKQSVDEVAQAIVACLKNPRPEVFPHAKSRGLAILSAIAPGYADNLVRKYARRRTVRPTAAPIDQG